jgi:hypothetical protein
MNIGYDSRSRWYSTKSWGMMRFSNFSELRLLIRAGGWVWVARAGLWLVPFRRLRPAVAFITSRTCMRTNTPVASQFAWAVSSVSRYVPRATCLTQALALHVLLRRAGLQSRIHIGVAKEGGRFEAHAWVESQDKVVIGDHELKRYTPIMVLD